MAAIDLGRIVSVPGRLCVGPTDLSLPFPHGGTSLGATRGIVFRPSYRFGEVPYECFGGEAGEVVYLGASGRAAAILRGVDADAWKAIVPETADGPTTQQAGVVTSFPGSTRAGAFRSGTAVKLLVSPDDELAHPALILYRAVPWVDPTAALLWQRGVVQELEVGFTALRRASDARAWQIARLDLVTL